MGREILTASSLGAILDCDLTTGNKIGGGTATDNTTILNNVLSTASPTNPIHLIIDGPTLITGLVIPATGFVTIEGNGFSSGFYMKSGSNNHVIMSAHTSETVLPGSRGSNVQIKNLTCNGNRLGNSTSGDLRFMPSGHWIFGIWLMNLDHILLENLYVLNIPMFAVLFDNCGDVDCKNIHIYDPYHTVNCDGIHIDGPANDIRISDCFFDNNGDDAVAINAPEGYCGTISRVAVSNCIFKNTLTMTRVYSILDSSHRALVDNVSFTNCVGSVGDIGLAFGTVVRIGNANSGSTNIDWIRHLSINNCRFLGSCFVDLLGDPIGDLEINNCVWHPNAGNAAIGCSAGTTIANLTFNNFTIYRDANAGTSVGVLQLNHSGSSIQRLNMQGIHIADPTASSYSPVDWLVHVPSGGTIANLRLDDIDPTQVTSILSSAGFANITSISGNAGTASGFQFPDAVMADGVVYLSSDDSGIPSVKVSGTPKRFTIT